MTCHALCVESSCRLRRHIASSWTYACPPCRALGVILPGQIRSATAVRADCQPRWLSAFHPRRAATALPRELALSPPLSSALLPPIVLCPYSPAEFRCFLPLCLLCYDPSRPSPTSPCHSRHLRPFQAIMKTTPNSAAATGHTQRPRILLRELRKRRHVRRPTLRALRACAEADRRCWYCKQPRRSDSLPCLQLAPENRPYFVCGTCQFPNVLCELCPWCLARCDAAALVAVVVRRRLSSPTLLNDAQKVQLARIEALNNVQAHGMRAATRRATSSHACRSEGAPDDLRELGGCEGQPEPATVDRVRREHRNAVLYSAADVVATATAVSMSPPALRCSPFAHWLVLRRTRACSLSSTKSLRRTLRTSSLNRGRRPWYRASLRPRRRRLHDLHALVRPRHECRRAMSPQRITVSLALRPQGLPLPYPTHPLCVANAACPSSASDRHARCGGARPPRARP